MPLRTGLLGYGIAGRVFHAPLIATTRGLELSAVVTSDATRRAHAEAAYPGLALPRTVDKPFAPTSADAALTDGGPLPVEPESAVRVPEVIEAASTSARTGQVVSR
ncbi:hypothetical protein ACQPYE_35610 [Actinosynnema sp. CA-299493]